MCRVMAASALAALEGSGRVVLVLAAMLCCWLACAEATVSKLASRPPRLHDDEERYRGALHVLCVWSEVSIGKRLNVRMRVVDPHGHSRFERLGV